jgi:hypothetical protein
VGAVSRTAGSTAGPIHPFGLRGLRSMFARRAPRGIAPTNDDLTNRKSETSYGQSD